MARERHVFLTDEIPHKWAHQTQTDARNSQGNLYFKGTILYSYRDSYPIANIVQGKKKNTKAYLVRSDTYSVTTSAHISGARRAIPNSELSFTVPSVQNEWTYAKNGIDHATNLAYLVKESQDYLKKATGARANGIRFLERAFEYKEQAIEYAKFFGLPSVIKSFSFLPKDAVLYDLQDKLKAREQKAHAAEAVRRAARTVRRETEHAEWEKRNALNALDIEKRIELWKTGESVNLGYSAPMLLRINGADVQTSHGARVPLAHAVRATRFILAYMAANRDYTAHGMLSEQVGPFKLQSISMEAQTVTIGCHVIPLAEIQRIAPELEAWAYTRKLEAISIPSQIV